MESRWSDDRLDELDARVGELAKRTERGFVEARTEMREFRAEMRAGFEQINQRFEQVDVRLEDVEAGLGRVETSLLETKVRVEGLEEQSQRFEKRLDGVIYMLFGFATSVLASLAALMAAHLLG